MLLEYHNPESEDSTNLAPRICFGCEVSCFLRCTDNCAAACTNSCAGGAKIE